MGDGVVLDHPVSRTRRAVETTLEGEDEVAALRRAVFSLADHTDDLIEMTEKLNKTIMTVGLGIITSLVAAAIGTLL